MSDAVQIALLQTIGGLLAGIPATIAAWFAYRTHVGVGKVQEQTDGMKTELVALTAKSSRAEGVLEGKLQEKEHHE